MNDAGNRLVNADFQGGGQGFPREFRKNRISLVRQYHACAAIMGLSCDITRVPQKEILGKCVKLSNRNGQIRILLL